MKMAFMDVVLTERYGVESKKKRSYKGPCKRWTVTQTTIGSSRFRREALVYLCIYRCVTAHTGAQYNKLNSMKEWSPVGVWVADSFCSVGQVWSLLPSNAGSRRRGWVHQEGPETHSSPHTCTHESMLTQMKKSIPTKCWNPQYCYWRHTRLE